MFPRSIFLGTGRVMCRQTYRLQVNFIKIVNSGHVSGRVIGEDPGIAFKFQRKNIRKGCNAGVLTPV